MASRASPRPCRPKAAGQRSPESATHPAAWVTVAREEGSDTAAWSAGARVDRSAHEEASPKLAGPTTWMAPAFGTPVLAESEPITMVTRAAYEPPNVAGDDNAPSLSLASRVRETPAGRRQGSPAPSVQRLAMGRTHSELPLAPAAGGATPAVQRAAAAWEAQAAAPPNPGPAVVPSVMVQRAPDVEAAPADGSPSSATGAAATARPGALRGSRKGQDE